MHEFSSYLTQSDVLTSKVDPSSKPLSAQNVAAEVSSLIANGCNTEIEPLQAMETNPKSGAVDSKTLETKTPEN